MLGGTKVSNFAASTDPLKVSNIEMFYGDFCRVPVLGLGGLGLGVDFVFPPSQVTTNPHQNLPEGSVLQTWYLAHRLNSQN